LIFLKGFGFYRNSESLNLPKEVRMRKALEELGPIFTKLGQTLSTRADLFEPKYIEELSKLQDRDPPFPWEDVRRIIYGDLGEEPETLFKSINKNPISSASLGQVHKAVLRDGTKVIVKVQRPDILPIMEQDVRIMKYMIGFLIDNNPDWKHYHPDALINEFAVSLIKEADYRYEAKYAMEFAKNFEEYEGVSVPKVFLEYATKRVYVMEYAEGESLKEFIKTAKKAKKDKILKVFLDSFMKQVFVDRFFHADPHPSNLKVMKDGTLVYLDFGSMKKLNQEFSEDLRRILIHLTEGSAEKVVADVERAGMMGPHTDPLILEDDVERLYVTFFQRQEYEIGKALEELFAVFRSHRLNIPKDYALLIRAVIEAEGVAKQLDTKFDTTEFVKVYLKNREIARVTEKITVKNLKEGLKDLIDSLSDLPKNITDLSTKIAEGTIKVELKHQSLEDLSKQLDKVSNRISASILLAAIMIGSTLLMQAGITSSLVDLPAIAAVGFFSAMFLGFWMVLRIFRRSGF
jgi:ubiquinone biosynthesis protein